MQTSGRATRVKRDGPHEALDHVLGAQRAPVAAYPWHASLSYDDPSLVPDFCGATLISKQALLTGKKCNNIKNYLMEHAKF